MISQCGSPIFGISKWISWHLKKLIPPVSTYLEDSEDYLNRIKKLGNIPKDSKFALFDAIAMYPNIGTEHALETFHKICYDGTFKIPELFLK